jgi:hypothetical protein
MLFYYWTKNISKTKKETGTIIKRYKYLSILKEDTCFDNENLNKSNKSNNSRPYQLD